jgi:mono/diheme cytochrome c family protein
MSPAARKILYSVVGLFAASLVAWMAWLNVQGDQHGMSAASANTPSPSASPQELVERGRALAHLGHCSGCHTRPGGPAYAGGAALLTPFGTVFGGNLTPERDTGLGTWTPDDFWRALHNGRSKNGRLLNPAFPYENFSHIRREDSDALFAYLQSLAPIRQESQPPNLRFPANTQLALAVWRALYFRPTDPASEALPTGEYLTRGLAHCSACHATRSALGAQIATHDFSGQLMPNGRAYAPPLPAAGRTSVGPWTVDDLVAYLKTGHSRQGAALGMMAEVVVGSTQWVAEDELKSMAGYILSRPSMETQKILVAGTSTETSTGAARGDSTRSTTTALDPHAASSSALKLGEQVYADHCAACHGARGEGVPGLYPPMAGNPRVARSPATNLIRIILEGGFGPSTEGHPRPFGMPPFAHVLKSEEVAAVATYMRHTWNDTPAEVTPLEVLKHR